MGKRTLTDAAQRHAQRLDVRRIDATEKRRALKFKNSLYSMTNTDLVWLAEMAEALTKSTGRVVSKSEIVRTGLRVLRGMEETEIIEVLNTPIQ